MSPRIHLLIKLTSDLWNPANLILSGLVLPLFVEYSCVSPFIQDSEPSSPKILN